MNQNQMGLNTIYPSFFENNKGANQHVHPVQSDIAFAIRFQWRSKNAEKITHIKGRLLEQAVIRFFKLSTSLKGKNLLPERAIFFILRAVPFGV